MPAFRHARSAAHDQQALIAGYACGHKQAVQSQLLLCSPCRLTDEALDDSVPRAGADCMGDAGQAALGALLSKSMQGSTPCIIRNKRQCGQPATSNPTAPSQQGGWLLLLTGIAAGRWAAQPHVQLQPVHARQLLCAGHGNLHTERCVAGDGPVGKHRHSQRGRCRMGGQGGV